MQGLLQEASDIQDVFSDSTRSFHQASGWSLFWLGQLPFALDMAACWRQANYGRVLTAQSPLATLKTIHMLRLLGLLRLLAQAIHEVNTSGVCIPLSNECSSSRQHLQLFKCHQSICGMPNFDQLTIPCGRGGISQGWRCVF